MEHETVTIRPFTDEELPAALDLLGLAFAEPSGEEDLAAERPVQVADRSQSAFADGVMVGCLGSYPFHLSVPGGELPCAGTTWVAVAPTHRRRGLLSRMMAAHLQDVRDAGEPLAALWASEAAIYGRYGYGVAAEQLRFTIDLRGGLPWAAHAPMADAQIRWVPLDEAAARITPIYEAVRRSRAGMHRRSEAWWDFQVLSERPQTRGGASYKKVAVAEVEGEDVAYAVYGAKEGWTPAGRPDGTVTVLELAGVDTPSEAAMWRFLAGLDLTSSITAFRRPVDDPLPWLLQDPRRVSRQLSDSLHVRVVDLPAALMGRQWADSVGLTIEVIDDRFEDNDGVWRVEVAPEGAAVQPSTDAPDLVMPIRTLGSLSLGGISVQRLADAGLLEVHNPAVLGPLDAALRTPRLPWAPEVW